MDRPQMTPDPGARVVHYVGDRARFTLTRPAGAGEGWTAMLRTNLTRARRMRDEVTGLGGRGPSEPLTFAGTAWRDIPMERTGEGWILDLPLTEVGYFRAKAYALDPEGFQHWPPGEDVGLSVHPDHLRTGNTLYCAFTRMFGPARGEARADQAELQSRLGELDARGYSVIPPSGKLRHLTAQVPHILETLGCRILHLLPLGPTPTTYARFGRFGSPYAQLDLTAIDPALVELDGRTTGVDQFQELAHAVHLRNGLLFLDIVVNHTGWGSRLMDGRPDWFKRNPDGSFHSPGAWGTTWEDLVELDHGQPELWRVVAESLLTWCRRGVDGFRCDAGYMVPLPAWQFIVARVRQEFPDCTFLLEGLGGAWEATEALLTEGGMQWAYSELFQNFAPREVSGYLDHCLRQSFRMGPLIHYSETHDNPRLAHRGRDWSLHRNRLCALASLSGGFGFTGGVEWLAAEKVDVHQCRGLAWGASPNLVEELGRLNRLLADHPCFFDGARLERLSREDSDVFALRRVSQEGLDQCLVLANLAQEPREWVLEEGLWEELGRPSLDLLGQPGPDVLLRQDGRVSLTLQALACHCLARHPEPRGLAGQAYRDLRAQASWAYQCLAAALPAEDLGPAPWPALGALAAADPEAFLRALAGLGRESARQDLLGALARPGSAYPQVVAWSVEDLARVSLLPPGHWLLVRDPAPFAVHLAFPGSRPLRVRSTRMAKGHAVAIPPSALPPGERPLDGEILLERFTEAQAPPPGRVRLLAPAPAFAKRFREGLCLLTNGRGAMARVQGNLGSVASKYDCLLGANLHPSAPSDRHVLAKRLRAWVNADGFITALDGGNLIHLDPGPPARWVFLASAGDGRAVQVELALELLPGLNTVVARFHRPAGPPGAGSDLPGDRRVTLTVRVDLEDRSYHQETLANEGADHHFRTRTEALEGREGFVFQPAPDRGLRVWSDLGRYHPEPEWSLGLPHPVEASRGMAPAGDAWSPGWFELPLERERPVTLVACADPQDPAPQALAPAPALPGPRKPPEGFRRRDSFGRQLRKASAAFLARRGEGMTVIAGYPWFQDWGRDTFIAARGLLAGGGAADVLGMLRTFGAFEDRGTLPNMLGAESTSDRDTSDAPLWFALAAEETAARLGPGVYREETGQGRTLAQVLLSIAAHYREGTPNGIHADPASGLVWSPSHFTWMDTNYPAGTPRQGYPVEIQALWIRLLRQLETLGLPGPWGETAARAQASLDLFWWEEAGCFHDLLLASPGTAAAQARPDGHLRPNQVFLVSLGLVQGGRARRTLEAVRRHLLVPGGLRSLAPLPVREPLPIHGPGGQLLNDPLHPYWGRYEGDEDTRRKPAYHNGTAWVWLLPSFCEALVRAYPGDPQARAAARAYVGSLDRLLETGCLGHLPEVLDGDAPHAQRGCDAQAWSATEALRVWLALGEDE